MRRRVERRQVQRVQMGEHILFLNNHDILVVVHIFVFVQVVCDKASPTQLGIGMRRDPFVDSH